MNTLDSLLHPVIMKLQYHADLAKRMSKKTRQTPNDVFQTAPSAIDLEKYIPGTFSEDAGATVIFTGTVRRHSRGRVVQHLFYDVYEEMALSEFASIGREIRERWNIEKLTIVHRTGSVEVGEISDFIAVSSEHRDEAYKASRYIIEELKSSVPIWKKEVWSGGEEWVQGS